MFVLTGVGTVSKVEGGRVHVRVDSDGATHRYNEEKVCNGKLAILEIASNRHILREKRRVSEMLAMGTLARTRADARGAVRYL